MSEWFSAYKVLSTAGDTITVGFRRNRIKGKLSLPMVLDCNVKNKDQVVPYNFFVNSLVTINFVFELFAQKRVFFGY
jgi:hypothetical protein